VFQVWYGGGVEHDLGKVGCVSGVVKSQGWVDQVSTA
jgi:hypothetical protein